MRVRDIMKEARTLLGDYSSVRWPLPELNIWISAGAREIANAKPSAAISNQVISLIQGTRQSLPANAVNLVRVMRNMSNNRQDPLQRIGKSAVTIVPREVLDTQIPDWHDASRVTPTKEVLHVVYDVEDPRTFYVYPPNTGAGRIEVALAIVPKSSPEGNPENSLTGYGYEITIDEGYWNALVDYVLYRAYSKDAEFAANRQLAADAYGRFAAAVGIRVQNAATTSPNTQNASDVPTAPRRGSM